MFNVKILINDVLKTLKRTAYVCYFIRVHKKNNYVLFSINYMSNRKTVLPPVGFESRSMQSVTTWVQIPRDKTIFLKYKVC